MDVHLQHQSLRIPVVRNATRTWTQRETLRLRLRCPRSGVVGYGEASPLPGFSVDTLDDVSAWFRGADLAQLSFHDVPSVSHLLSQATLGESSTPPAARFCLESALLTGFCVARGIQLEHALAMLPDNSQTLAQQPDVLTAPLESAALLDVFGDAPEARAVELSNAGTRVFKIKIGRDVVAETRKLRAIVGVLRSMHRTVRLRLDANQSLTPRAVRELARACDGLPVDYVEEPCPTADLATVDVQRGLGLPVALDESLTAGAEALRPWLNSGHVRALVCKPMYLGGIMTTREWALLAHARGIEIVMSHLFDGPWALRVYEAMARVFSPGAVAGLAPHPALAGWQRDPNPPEQVPTVEGGQSSK